MIRHAAKALLAALFVVCAYRAFTQSLIYDEALTYGLYVAGPFANVFHYFDANHHFLNTILMRFSASIFGDAEWALRLPVLAAATLYFTAVYRIAAAAFGEGWTFLVAVGLLSLNPFVLDFMAVARGYGMALALMMFAIALLLEGFTAGVIAPRTLAWAGALLALSVTANLVFVLPVTAIFGLTLYLLPWPAKTEAATKRQKRKSAKSGPALWLWLCAPIGAIALLFFLLYPFENMQAAQFYAGAATLPESLRSMATTSLQHSGPLRYVHAMDYWRDAVAFAIAPAIAAAGLVLGWKQRSLVLLFASVPIVFAGVAALAMHSLFGTPYPEDRTGLYFAPLVCLALMGLPRVGVAVALVFLVQFATEFNTKKFYMWEYDADTRTIGEYIAQHNSGSNPVRFGGSWQLWESMQYYKNRNHWDWLEIERKSPEQGYDYYAFVAADAAAARTPGLTVVFRGDVSGSIVVTPVK
jgi:uncharacterized membrane protein